MALATRYRGQANALDNEGYNLLAYEFCNLAKMYEHTANSIVEENRAN